MDTSSPPPSYAETMQQKGIEPNPNPAPYPPNPTFTYPANPVGAEVPSSSVPQPTPPVNVTLVQATTPLFGPHPVATDCFYCHVSCPFIF